ncbi:glycosyltransferase [Butyrivibrio sp. VCD2006]|uniref:glycosyltransferase n=1 Tax=Butyrivibrio sp. VCD2006 TaxID=1280664 RepID=UPI000401318E|nr:glycosyltransferase [Butyrivibrio sp. VCD2006]
MKVAIVHDWLPFMGGAENVIINMHEVFPDAPIYTSMCNKMNLCKTLQDADIRTTHLQKTTKKQLNHRKLFPFMPTAMESINLNGYDVVISSSTSVGKSVITGPDTLHICYCNTPMRYAWEQRHNYIGPLVGKGSFKNKMISYFMTFMRVWDYASSARVDVFVGNSVNVARRIHKHYRRDAYVIHCPVRMSMFHISPEDGDYYLCVSRLQEYKGIELAVKACTRENLPLYVIGTGPMRDKLEAMAGPTVKFLGYVQNDELIDYYAKCKALIFPGVEDFGITPLEAQACGRPVIALGKGGILETIIENETGVFFNEATPEALIDAIHRFEKLKFDKEKLRAHAMEFDESVFRDRLKRFVEEQYAIFKSRQLEGITVYK